MNMQTGRRQRHGGAAQRIKDDAASFRRYQLARISLAFDCETPIKGGVFASVRGRIDVEMKVKTGMEMVNCLTPNEHRRLLCTRGHQAVFHLTKITQRSVHGHWYHIVARHPHAVSPGEDNESIA